MEDKTYNVAETFYSLKGEGRWTGTPMYFIRLSGCNLDCSFCDTDYAKLEGKPRKMKELVNEIVANPAVVEHVVVTGGEPTCQDIQPLVRLLRNLGYKVHLETNGTNDIPDSIFWVTVSPKSPHGALSGQALQKADEIKFLVGKMDDRMEEEYKGWENYIDAVLAYVADIKAELMVMPIADPTSRTLASLEWDSITAAVKYCLEHPHFSLTMQMHKVLNIP